MPRPRRKARRGRPEAQLMPAAVINRARQARELFRAARSGVLSSHSTKFPGYPYGSALPHVADHWGRPAILISHLAEHTHNVEADRRVSFLVSDAGPDLQASSRAALLGDAHPIEDDEVIRARYLRFFPEQAQYLELGGFRFWAIEPVQIRFIEGFGSLHWIAGERYLGTPGEVPDAEPSILEHMNQDHRDALLAYCRHAYGSEAQRIEMIGIDCDGFDVRADDRLLRFAFDQPIANATEARAALVALARVSRG
jgi:putative heme iron utilization protein